MRPVRKSPEKPIPIASTRVNVCRGTTSTVTNREAGYESEIDRIPERPALNKTNQQAQGKLNPQNCRQHRPRHANGMAERHEKAPPHRFRRRPVHVMATSVTGLGFLGQAESIPLPQVSSKFVTYSVGS